MYKNKKNNSKKSKALLVAIAMGLIPIIGFSVLFILNRLNGNVSTVTQPKPAINYNPPTKQELAETKDQKDKLSSSSESKTGQPTAPLNPATLTKVTPVITSWAYSESYLQVSGFVPGIIETIGECTLNAVNGSVIVTESSPGTPNAQNVSCGLIKIPRSKLRAGTWTITLSYKSPTFIGTSEAKSQVVN